MWAEGEEKLEGEEGGGGGKEGKQMRRRHGKNSRGVKQWHAAHTRIKVKYKGKV